MDIFARKHLTVWLIALLAAMNLLTLGTLWYTVLRKPAAAAAAAPPREATRPANINRFLEKELGLTAAQAARFEELRKLHAVGIQALQAEIKRLKKAEMDELLAPSDPPRGDALAQAVGAKEAEKEKLLYAHLKELMALCDPAQRERFRRILGELLTLMAPPGQPGPRRKPPEAKPGEPREDRPADQAPDLRPPRPGEGPDDKRPPRPDDKRPPRPGEERPIR